jgi:hypothetical protein
MDVKGRPLVLTGSLSNGFSVTGKGSFTNHCEFIAEIADPAVHNVSLKIPNWGWLMVNNQRETTIFLDQKIIEEKHNFFYKFLTYLQPNTAADAALQFIVRSYEDNKVTFESRKFDNTFLCVDQDGIHRVSVKEIPPNSSEVQFVVRVQRFKGQYTTHIACPFGRPSIVNQLKDRSVIQLYCKTTGAYLGLRVSGDVVGMTNPDNDKTFLVYCDRGLGRVSLQSYTPPLLKIKMKFNGALTCQGEENLDNDFYLKEAPDGSVLFESAPNKGRYISITMRDKKTATIIRNFSINLLVFGEERGKKTTVTKYSLN